MDLRWVGQTPPVCVTSASLRAFFIQSEFVIRIPSATNRPNISLRNVSALERTRIAMSPGSMPRCQSLLDDVDHSVEFTIRVCESKLGENSGAVWVVWHEPCLCRPR